MLMSDDNLGQKPSQASNESSKLRELSEQFETLNRKKTEIGLEAFRVIEREEVELARQLREAFDDKQLIAGWLTSDLIVLGKSPLGSLAGGERETVVQILVNINHGFCA
jgi:hypothetical protein